MAILLRTIKVLYIPKLSCICWHVSVKKVEQIMQEEIVFRNQVAPSHAT